MLASADAPPDAPQGPQAAQDAPPDAPPDTTGQLLRRAQGRILPLAGAGVGTVLAAPGGPAAMVGGGALGYAAGKGADRLLGQFEGDAPLAPLPDQIKDVGQSLGEGAKQTALGMSIGPALGAAGRGAVAAGDALTGGGVTAAGQFIKNTAIPQALGLLTNTVPNAWRALFEDDNNLNDYGKPEDVAATVGDIQKSLTSAREAAGANIQAVREKYGANVTPDEMVDTLAAGRFAPRGAASGVSPAYLAKFPDQAGEFVDEAAGRNIMGASAQEIAQQFKNLQAAQGQIKPETEIGGLLSLRQAIDNKLKFPEGEVPEVQSQMSVPLNHMRKTINTRLDAIAPDVREADLGFSKVANLYDDLQGTLESQGAAEDKLRQLFTTPTAKNRETLQELARLDDINGSDHLGDLFKHFSAQEMSRVFGRPFLSAIGLRDILLGHPETGATMIGVTSPLAIRAAVGAGRTAGQVMSSPALKPALGAGVMAAGNVLSRLRGQQDAPPDGPSQ